MRYLIMRNLLATLAFSRGVPMLSHGDEMARTQYGNYYAYCQDSALTFLLWLLHEVDQELHDFVSSVFSLRLQLDLGHLQQESWISAHCGQMTAADIETRRPLPFGWLRHHQKQDSLTVFNGDTREHLFELPETDGPRSWHLVLNTTAAGNRQLRGHAVRLAARSVLLLISQH